jgi:cytochrome P450 family 26 subfamily A
VPFYFIFDVTLVQIFKTHLLFSPTVFVDGPEWNKFLFSNENKLISTTWPMSIGKLLGAKSVANKIGEEHK